MAENGNQSWLSDSSDYRQSIVNAVARVCVCVFLLYSIQLGGQRSPLSKCGVLPNGLSPLGIGTGRTCTRTRFRVVSPGL